MTDRLFELGIEDSIPLVVEDTIALCLAKDPAKRPQSISQVLQLLERSEVPAPVSQPQPEGPKPPEPPAPPPQVNESKAPEAPPEVAPPGESPVPAEPPQRGPRAKPILAAAVIGALAMLAIIGWLWTNHGAKTPAATTARAGSLDPAFRPATNADNEIRVALEQPDRKILVGGMFTQFGEGRHQGIARLQPDGALDATFTATTAGNVHALALQPDAKLLAVGEFEAFDRKPCRRLVRLVSNGTVDAAFNTGSGADGTVFAVALQPDGKIVVAGDFNRLNQVERNRIARLNPDGSVDPTFNPGAGPNTGIRCLALQPDGKILIGGIFTSVNGVARNRIARLKQDGSVDTSFDPGEGANEVVRWMAPEADGMVVVVGGL